MKLSLTSHLIAEVVSDFPAQRGAIHVVRQGPVTWIADDFSIRSMVSGNRFYR